MPVAIAVAAVAVSAATAVYSITQQKKAADQAEKAAEATAKAQIDRGNLEASRIKENAHRLAASQEAQLAASGVKLGEGLGAELPAETIFLGERDALQAIKDAKTNARLTGLRADAMQTTANANMIGTGLGFISNTLNVFNSPAGQKLFSSSAQTGSTDFSSYAEASGPAPASYRIF